MTYYDMFCRLYQNDEMKCFNLEYDCLFYILGINGNDVFVNPDIETKLLGELDKFIEQGFNEGFKFAIKIFLGNL